MKQIYPELIQLLLKFHKVDVKMELHHMLYIRGKFSQITLFLFHGHKHESLH